MFELTHEPIGVLELSLRHSGAVTTFEGLVRDLNEGMPVVALEYEAFEPLAISEGTKIVEEAKAKFKVADVACVHRLGRLAVGEMAIKAVASAAHRRAAFEACEYVVEEVKKRVPIWKKEHYLEGESAWVNSPGAPAQATERFDRQARLPDVGETGQSKISAGRVLVIGAGGLGCPALSYLAGAGVGIIGICDFDDVELSNLPRQTLYTTADCGEPKAVVAARALERQTPGIAVKVHRERANHRNLPTVTEGYDVVLDCTDGWQAKREINEHCVKAGLPLVSASLHRWEGTIWTWTPEVEAGCFACHLRSPEGSAATCEEAGVVGPVAGALGAWQASEALRILLGLTPAFGDSTLLMDFAVGRATSLRRPRDQSCLACGEERRESVRRDVALTAPSEIERFVVVDLRLNAKGDLPVLSIRAEVESLEAIAKSSGAPLLLVCDSGSRSLAVANRLVRDVGCDAWSLTGGVSALERLMSATVAR